MRLTYIITIIIISAWSFNEISNKNKEIENLNNQMSYTVNQYNSLNHKYHDLRCDVEYLRESNEALLRYAEPRSVVKAIKHTPPPKLIKG